MDCPSYQELAEAAFAVPTPLGDQTSPHEGCVECAKKWALLVRMRDAFAEGALPAPPPHLRRLAEGAAEDQGAPVQGRGLGSKLRVLIAELVPRAVPPMMPAMRRGKSSSTRLHYRAGPYEIDLGLSSDGMLLGQLATDSGARFSDAWCTLSGRASAMVPLRDTGEFSIDNVGRDAGDLTLEWDETRVLVPDVKFGN